VVHLPGEHPGELGLAEAALEIGHAVSYFLDDGLVVLGGAELEELLRVPDVARELLDLLDELGDPCALARDRLGLLRVVPKAGRERRLVEARDVVLQFRDVKDAPLAS
jgi:hypothetical protein